MNEALSDALREAMLHEDRGANFNALRFVGERLRLAAKSGHALSMRARK